MSATGIELTASIFDAIQKTRLKLIAAGSKRPSKPACQQDLKLAQLLEKMKDSAQEDFLKIIGG